MKKLFTLIILGSVTTMAFADQYQYDQHYGNRGNYYQNQPIPDDYYQQNSQGYYYQRDPYYQQQYYQPQHYQQQLPRNLNQNYYQQNDNYQQNDSNSYWFHQENPGNISDQDLGKKIQDYLSAGWFSKGFKNVAFDVNNGIVNLRGSVDTLENRNKVEDGIKKIEGVRQVYNHMTIVQEKPGTYSAADLENSEKKYPQDAASTLHDRQINAKIRSNLSGWFSNGYENIAIRTANGVVVISGTVDNPQDIQKIKDHLKKIDGVKTIDSQLTVKNK